MPNWCSNRIVVTGSPEEIARFARTCIRQDQNGQPWFDFNSLIPMPAIIENTIVTFDDILMALSPDGSIPQPLKEQAGEPNWYVWAIRNWGTKWNACDFKVIAENPERYECRFETAWSPPEPVYVKLTEMFPRLCFEISGGDDQLNFDFEATARNGAFSIQYGDPTKEGFCWSTDSDFLLDHAKAYGNDPKRFLCVALCQAIASDQCYGEDEGPECEKAVVAWARGDSKEQSENSCRDIIARNDRWIKKPLTDWQFTVYAPGEIRFGAHTVVEALGVASNDDLPF